MSPFKNMNLFQNANIAARFLIFAALVFGISEAMKAHHNASISSSQLISVVLISVFIVIFNIKATIDDHHYFETAFDNKPLPAYAGLVLAVFAWIFFGVAATTVYSPEDSVEMLGISFLVSTAWIVVHLAEITIDRERRNREVFISLIRQKWLLINLLYIGCFVVFLGWLDPVIKPGRNYVLVVLFIILLYDVFSSYPFGSGKNSES